MPRQREGNASHPSEAPSLPPKGSSSAPVADLVSETVAFASFFLGQAASGSIMLDKLLVGLVPLLCRVLDYFVINDGAGREWIVHRDVLVDLAEAKHEPLCLVGFGVVVSPPRTP